MSDPQVLPDVVVAVLTYRRPRHIEQVVPALCEQLDRAADRCRRAGVLVVDNDPQGSARELVARVGDPRVRYVHEPSPGIVAARNRALDAAGAADVLVFIDDDERPSSQWLAELLGTYLEHRPGAVVGAVSCVFETEPEPWIRQGGFFDRRRMPTGTVTDVAATNNLLLDLHVVRSLGLRFDQRFARIGGSDHLFTRQLVSAGHAVLWNNEAVVTDLVPSSRLTRRWVTRRAFRIGSTAALVAVQLAHGPAGRAGARAGHAARGLSRVAGGAVRYAAGAVTGSVGRRAAGTRNVWRGLGLLAGAVGLGYAEYAREARGSQLSAVQAGGS